MSFRLETGRRILRCQTLMQMTSLWKTYLYHHNNYNNNVYITLLSYNNNNIYTHLTAKQLPSLHRTATCVDTTEQNTRWAMWINSQRTSSEGMQKIPMSTDSQLVLWAQSATKDYIRARNRRQSISYLFQTSFPQNINKHQKQQHKTQPL